MCEEDMEATSLEERERENQAVFFTVISRLKLKEDHAKADIMLK